MSAWSGSEKSPPHVPCRQLSSNSLLRSYEREREREGSWRYLTSQQRQTGHTHRASDFGNYLGAQGVRQGETHLCKSLNSFLLLPAQPPALGSHLLPQRPELFLQDLDAAPVLGHTGLKFPDLGVRSWDIRAFPFLFHAALTLQLLELQILIGALGCIQLLSDLRVRTQRTGDWIPKPEEGVS